MKRLSTLFLALILSFTFGLANLLAQPANDLIANAIDLGHGPIPFTHDIPVDFPNATNTNDATPSGAPAVSCALTQSAVWYKFTATKAGTVDAAITSPNNPVIVFFEGPAEGVTSGMQLTYVIQASNTCAVGSTSSITTSPGVTYYVYVKNNTASNVTIDATNAFQEPENDLISNAINLNQEQMPYVEENIHFLMATNTDDSGQLDCTTGTIPGIWYKVTPQQNGQINASLSSIFVDSILIIYESLNPDATTGIQLTWVDQPNNACGVGNFASVDAVVGKTYYIFAASADPYADIDIDVSLVLRAEENNFIDFSYYPNPVINELHIKSKTTIDEIKVFNLLGQQVLRQKINSTNGNIFLSNLKNGLYLAEINADGKKSTFKIVKK